MIRRCHQDAITMPSLIAFSKVLARLPCPTLCVLTKYDFVPRTEEFVISGVGSQCCQTKPKHTRALPVLLDSNCAKAWVKPQGRVVNVILTGGSLDIQCSHERSLKAALRFSLDTVLAYGLRFNFRRSLWSLQTPPKGKLLKYPWKQGTLSPHNPA